MQLDLFSPVNDQRLSPWTVAIGGRHVPYTLRKSARARRVWIKVSAEEGLEVVVPSRMPLTGLHKILADKAAWIEKNLARFEAAGRAAPRPVIKDGAELPLLGRAHTLRVLDCKERKASVRLSGSDIIVSVPDDRVATLKNALKAWYRERAKEIITRRVDELKEGRRVGRVSIKDQKTRWGSCSAKGDLSFNWRLVMAPPRVLDYLILHEIMHMERPDHSRHFWDKVAAVCPDYKELAKWLKTNGPALSGW